VHLKIVLQKKQRLLEKKTASTPSVLSLSSFLHLFMIFARFCDSVLLVFRKLGGKHEYKYKNEKNSTTKFYKQK
jgi:hypothetical protein